LSAWTETELRAEAKRLREAAWADLQVEVKRLREANDQLREGLLWIVNVAATEQQYKQVAREALGS
jgi:hypothetical protein